MNDYNLVKNWILTCFSVKNGQSDKVKILRCSKSGQKKEDGTYGLSMNIDVVVNATKIDLPDSLEKDLNDRGRAFLEVSGGFSVGEWAKNDGNKVLTFTIFADEIKEHHFTKE